MSYRDLWRAVNRCRWARVRRACFDRDGWQCRRCGRAGRLEAHHDPPLVEGIDPYALDGLVTLCRACHVGRHGRALTEDEKAWQRAVEDLAG